MSQSSPNLTALTNRRGVSNLTPSIESELNMSKPHSPWKPVILEFFTDNAAGKDLRHQYDIGQITVNKLVTHESLIEHLKANRPEGVQGLPAKNSILKWLQEKFGIVARSLKEEKAAAKKRSIAANLQAQLDDLDARPNAIRLQIEALEADYKKAVEATIVDREYWRRCLDDYLRQHPTAAPTSVQDEDAIDVQVDTPESVFADDDYAVAD